MVSASAIRRCERSHNALLTTSKTAWISHQTEMHELRWDKSSFMHYLCKNEIKKSFHFWIWEIEFKCTYERLNVSWTSKPQQNSYYSSVIISLFTDTPACGSGHFSWSWPADDLLTADMVKSSLTQGFWTRKTAVGGVWNTALSY